jgi:hypothetical protein
MRNFKRIRINEEILKIHLTFNTSSFIKIKLGEYKKMLQILYKNSNNKNIINPLTNTVISDSPHFERRLYGISLNDDAKKEIYDALSKNKKIIEKEYLYINTVNNEIILSDIKIDDLDRFIITNINKDFICLNVKNDASLVDSHIFGSEDLINSWNYQLLVTRIRFINYLIYSILGIFDEYSKAQVKVEGFVDLNMLEQISEKISENNFKKKYLSLNINRVLDSVRVGNNFVLNEI